MSAFSLAGLTDLPGKLRNPERFSPRLAFRNNHDILESTDFRQQQKRGSAMPDSKVHSALTRAALALQTADTGDNEKLIGEYCSWPDRFSVCSAKCRWDRKLRRRSSIRSARMSVITAATASTIFCFPTGSITWTWPTVFSGSEKRLPVTQACSRKENEAPPDRRHEADDLRGLLLDRSDESDLSDNRGRHGMTRDLWQRTCAE